MSKTNLLAAFLGGAAVGALAGLLLAPKSGAETRDQIRKAKNKSGEYVDQLLEEGKKSWFQAKGSAEKSAGIAADEVDGFIRHIVKSGEKLWGKAKNRASGLADDATDAMDDAMQNGKKAARRVTDSVS